MSVNSPLWFTVYTIDWYPLTGTTINWKNMPRSPYIPLHKMSPVCEAFRNVCWRFKTETQTIKFMIGQYYWLVALAYCSTEFRDILNFCAVREPLVHCLKNYHANLHFIIITVYKFVWIFFLTGWILPQQWLTKKRRVLPTTQKWATNNNKGNS